MSVSSQTDCVESTPLRTNMPLRPLFCRDVASHQGAEIAVVLRECVEGARGPPPVVDQVGVERIDVDADHGRAVAGRAAAIEIVVQEGVVDDHRLGAEDIDRARAVGAPAGAVGIGARRRGAVGIVFDEAIRNPQLALAGFDRVEGGKTALDARQAARKRDHGVVDADLGNGIARMPPQSPGCGVLVVVGGVAAVGSYGV